jgi:hypothetical protein
MSERKLMSKYVPKDFDPSELPKLGYVRSKLSNKGEKSRIMLPFSLQCLGCGELLNVGKKFNATKETTKKKYLTISIFRFYFRCTCGQQITFLTDPASRDYTVESGAQRLNDKYLEARNRRIAAKEEEKNPAFTSNIDEIQQNAMKSRQNALDLEELEQMYEDQFEAEKIMMAVGSGDNNGKIDGEIGDENDDKNDENEFFKLQRAKQVLNTQSKLDELEDYDVWSSRFEIGRDSDGDGDGGDGDGDNSLDDEIDDCQSSARCFEKNKKRRLYNGDSDDNSENDDDNSLIGGTLSQMIKRSKSNRDNISHNNHNGHTNPNNSIKNDQNITVQLPPRQELIVDPISLGLDDYDDE